MKETIEYQDQENKNMNKWKHAYIYTSSLATSGFRSLQEKLS